MTQTTSRSPLAISSRVAALKPSVTVAFMNRAKALKAEGKDVLSFAAGEPDFDTPDNIKEAAITALRAGQTKYMPTLGDPATRAAIAKKLNEENGVPATPEHVAISSGGKHSLFVACHCVLDDPRLRAEKGLPPQEVLLPVPTWVSYAPIAELAGGKVVEIETGPEGGFKITPEQLRAAITPRSRLLIINSPSNPCGTMYSPDELRALGRVVAEAAATKAPDLLVLSDEIYEKIVYGGVEHFSLGSMPEIAERVITLNGLSKAYSMTGWRIGYTGSAGKFGLEFTKAMATLQGQMSTNITSFVYPAIRTALAQGGESVERMRQAFAARARVIDQRLATIPGVRNVRATGAFYAFPEVSDHFGTISPAGKPINSAMDLCEALLSEALVAFVPGEDFGGCGRNHVRISFACSEDQINKGMDRFADFLAKLRKA
ncbi:MAG: pyridoxal phosphate-dependent aminotransferase [Planctomycetota bacterium]|nr:pyridoxal phosphate-dependent aminotransferase [Planctomycetota bacterium]